MKRVIALIIIWLAGGTCAALLLLGQVFIFIDAYHHVRMAQSLLEGEGLVLAIFSIICAVCWALTELSRGAP